MCYKYGLRCLPPPNTHTHPVLQKEKKKKTGKERWPVNYEHIS